MSRIRSIKPEFFTSEQVVECSPSARLLFIGMWCFCDDGGVHPASFRRIKMEVFPGDLIEEVEIKTLIAELLNAGLITEFSAEDKTWWAVTGWHHQKIDRPTFRYPSPNGRRVVVESSPPEGSRGESNKKNKQKRNARFVPPTEEEVAAYCLERGNDIDAGSFLAHYTANGWKRGKTPVKDWRACVITWEKNRNGSAKPKKARAPTADDILNWSPHGGDR